MRLSSPLWPLAALLMAACDRPTSPEETAASTVSAASHFASRPIADRLGVRRLGTLGGSYSFGNDINNRTQVVGAAGNPGDFDRPFLWTPGQGMRNLGTLGGDHAAATGVNDRSDVTGVGLNKSNTADRAFLWIDGRGMRGLGTLGGRNSFATEVNDQRQVTGDSDLPNGKDRAFLWSPGEGMRSLGNLGAESNDVWAQDINNATQVVGTIWIRGFTEDPEYLPPHRPFIWTPERGMRKLPTLGGENARPFSINERGDIVGFSNVESGRTVAALWRANGRTVKLGTLGGDEAAAFGINNDRVVVGFSLTAEGLALPFVWTRESGMQPLRIAGVGGNEGEATAVNENNEISGTIFRPDAPPVAVLWRPREDQVATSTMDAEDAYTMTVTGVVEPRAVLGSVRGRCALESRTTNRNLSVRIQQTRCAR